MSDAVEHAARADRRQLLAVTDGDELRTRALDQLGEGVHALVVDHPGLIEDHRRLGPDLEAAAVRSHDQRVHRQRVPLQCGAGDPEPLGGGPRHGDAEHLAARDLLGACRGVDHDTLPGPRGPDQHRDPLRAGHGPQGLLLLDGQGCAYALGDLPARVRSGPLADVTARRLGELVGASLDRLLLGPDRRASSSSRPPR